MVTVSGPGVQIGGEVGDWGANALTEKAWKDAVHLGTWQGIVHASWDPSAEANCDGNIK